MLKTIGSLSSATVRSTDLLQGLDELERFRDFEDEYRAQVAGLHATMKLPHAGTTRQVPYEQLFVEPEVWIGPQSDSLRDDERRLDVPELLRHSTRAVILGDPGGGKSTLSRKLTHDLAAGRVTGSVQRTPFFVELRDYATVVRGRHKQTLIEYLEGRCRSPYNIEAPNEAIEWLLLTDRAMVILDGLDELLDTSLRRDVVEAVQGFALRYPTCPMLVTSRRVGYDEAPLDPDLFATVQLGEFTPDKVLAYVQKWFRLDESVETARQEGLANSFMEDSLFVADLRVNPLMLSLMCGIYASENYIPRNRPDVYEKCALLLFERWDKQRGIQAPLSFDAHVQAAMRSLALHMYKTEADAGSGAGEAQGVREGMSRAKLVSYMKAYLREKRFDDDDTAETAAAEFIEFCKGRAWVLTDIGSETYGFTHQTFLEYFAASQLVRHHTSPGALYAELKSYIRSGGWDVVAQLAVQILGRATEDGADDFLQLVIADASGLSVSDLYASSFAVRALQFVVPRPDVLRSIVVKALEIHLADEGQHADEKGLAAKRNELGARVQPELLAVNSENAPRVGSVLRDLLRARLHENVHDEPALRTALLNTSYGPTTFWSAWSAENLVEFAAAVTAQRTTAHWVALIELDRGRVTFKQVVDWHGVGCLYDWDFMGLGRTGLPFFFRLLAVRHKGGYFGLVQPVSPARTKVVQQQVIQDLVKRRAPWFSDIMGLERWVWFVEQEAKSDIARLGLVSLMLLLPLVEVHIQMVANGAPLGPLPAWLRPLADARTNEAELDDLGEPLRAKIRDVPDAEAFFERWLSKEISLLPPTSRRRPGLRRAGSARA